VDKPKTLDEAKGKSFREVPGLTIKANHLTAWDHRKRGRNGSRWYF